jgi:hypothetical protein
MHGYLTSTRSLADLDTLPPPPPLSTTVSQSRVCLCLLNLAGVLEIPITDRGPSSVLRIGTGATITNYLVPSHISWKLIPCARCQLELLAATSTCLFKLYRRLVCTLDGQQMSRNGRGVAG